MVNLETILEYQDTDIRLRRALDSIEKSDAAQRGKKAKQEFDAAKKQVDDSEAAAAEILDYLKEVDGVSVEAKKKLAACDEKVKTGKLTSKERKALTAELEGLKNKLTDYEKRTESKKKRGAKVYDEFMAGQTRAKKMRDVFLKERGEFEGLKEKKEPEIKKYKERLAALREKVDPALMKRYDELVAERKIPAYVDAYKTTAGTYACRGCGLQLSQADTAALSKDGVCRCGNCRRVVYLNKTK